MLQVLPCPDGACHGSEECNAKCPPHRKDDARDVTFGEPLLKQRSALCLSCDASFCFCDYSLRPSHSAVKRFSNQTKNARRLSSRHRVSRLFSYKPPPDNESDTGAVPPLLAFAPPPPSPLPDHGWSSSHLLGWAVSLT